HCRRDEYRGGRPAYGAERRGGTPYLQKAEDTCTGGDGGDPRSASQAEGEVSAGAPAHGRRSRRSSPPRSAEKRPRSGDAKQADRVTMVPGAVIERPRSTGIPVHEPAADEVNACVAAIRLNGEIGHPLTVRPIEDGRFELVDGQYRLAGALKLGLVEVPC